MPKLFLFLFLFTVIVAVHRLDAVTQLTGKAAEAAELQDRIDRREKEIATMAGYSERLERMLVHAGLPPDESVRQLFPDQKMDHPLTRTYDVTAILLRYQASNLGSDVLAKLVTDTVAPDSWLDVGGSVGTLHFTGGKMVVTQMPENLAAVEKLLGELDEHKQIAHRRAIVDRQETALAALTREIDKRVARCRSVAIRVPPRLDRAMELALPDTEFIGSPLSTCFDSLASASGQLIHVNWNLLAAAGVDHRMPIMLSLHRQTLAAALMSLIGKASEGGARLQYDASGNSIYVSTQEEFDKLTVTRVYDVRDILPMRGNRDAAVDQLVNMITTNMDPDSWKDAGGTVGSIRELQGQLIVTHCERVQVRIRAYLDKRLAHDCATSRSRPSP